MSNFQQTSPVQYKDYVAQNPVELMATVGMQREQQLQAGIEKVNTIASQVSSIDLIKDSDKQHLQTKIAELKSGITTNLSGDFSDQRIVGQIAGAASQVYKDPQIKDGILNTMQVRKGQAEMEAARKDGKNGPSNDAYFNKKLNNYLTSEDPKASFNYNYEKYTDVNKNIFDIVGKLLPSGTTTDEAFTTVIDKKTGKSTQVLADYVLRNGFKGVLPEQIKSALRQGLSTQDFRQLELDGIYNYSNITPEEFSNNVHERYSNIAKKYQDKIDIIDNSNTNSPYEKAQLKSTKDGLTQEINRLKQEYEGVTSTFKFGDTDSGKAKLYTMDKINGLSASLSHGEITKTITGDTPQQMAFNRDKENNRVREFEAKFAQDNRFHEDDLQEKKIANNLKKRELSGSQDLPFKKDELPDITPQKLVEDNAKLENDIGLDKEKFKSDWGITEGAYNQAAHDYLTDPAKLNAIQFSHFSKMTDDAGKLVANRAFLSNVLKEADNNKDFKKIEQFIPKDAPSITYTEGNEKYIFTPKELANPSVFKDVYEKILNRPAGVSQEQALEQATQLLSTNEKKLIKIQFKANFGNATDPISQGDKVIMDNIIHYDQTVGRPYGINLAAKNNYIKQKIQDGVLVKSKSSTGFDLSNEAEKDAGKKTLAELADIAGSYDQGKIGNATKENLLDLASDDHKVMTMISSGGSQYQAPSYNLHVKGKAGTFDIPLSTEQVRQKWGVKFEASEEDKSFQFIADRFQMSGGVSTKLGGVAFLQKNKFPNVTNYGIQGEVLKDKNTGLYLLQLNIHNPITGKPVTTTFPPGRAATDKAGIISAIQRLDDAGIYQLLDEKYKKPTQEQLKELEVAAQKPFKN